MEKSSFDYSIQQKKYIVISVVCIIVALSSLILDVTLKPHLNALTKTALNPTPYMVYILTVPAITYLSVGILVPAAASLGMDLRFRTGVRVTILIFGTVMLLLYLFIPLSLFTGLLEIFPALLPLYKVLYYNFLAETQKLTASLFGLSVFLFFNK